MRSKLVTMPLAGLIEDMAIYPRHAIDSTHVASLVGALEAGETLPPIVADNASKRISDGWHRGRAHKRHSGPECEVEVLLVTYPNEAAIMLDAVARNATHGRRLDAMDRRRSVLMLRAVGLSDAKIGEAMRLPESRVETLSIRVAEAPKSSEGVIPGTSSIALKRCSFHLAGARMTKRQADAHRSMPGTTLTLIARQLRLALTEGLANMADDKLMDELRMLEEVLGPVVASVPT